MISGLSTFVPALDFAGTADPVVDTWLPDAVAAGAGVSTPGTSEKPESSLLVWHPAKSMPARKTQDTTQRRSQTCRTFIFAMRPLILLTLWFRHDRFYLLLREQRFPRRHCGNSNRGNSHCSNSSSRLATC